MTLTQQVRPLWMPLNNPVITQLRIKYLDFVNREANFARGSTVPITSPWSICAIRFATSGDRFWKS
jgi:hypothetical protein